MKKVTLGLLLFSLFLLSSCKNNNPQTSLDHFFDAMAKKDISTARKYCTEASKDMLDMLEKQSQIDSNAIETSQYDKNKLSFSEPVIEGDKATIKVTQKEKNESINFHLKKENNEWKVAFDKETTIGMGMESVGGTDNSALRDSINRSMDTLAEVSIDSIREGMRSELKKIDSVRNLLKKH